MTDQSLAEFIRANYQLISVFGVFIALMGFVNNLQLGAFGGLLILLFFVCAVLLWLELAAQFPTSNASWRLRLFDSLLWMITGSVALYWFAVLQSMWVGFYTVFFVGFLLGLSWRTIVRARELHELYRAEPQRRAYVYASYIVLALVLGFFILSFYGYLNAGSPFAFLHLFRGSEQ